MLGCRASSRLSVLNPSKAFRSHQIKQTLAIRPSPGTNLPHKLFNFNRQPFSFSTVRPLSAIKEQRINSSENGIVNSVLRDHLSSVSTTLKAVNELANWKEMQDEVSSIQTELDVCCCFNMQELTLTRLSSQKTHGIILKLP